MVQRALEASLLLTAVPSVLSMLLWPAEEGAPVSGTGTDRMKHLAAAIPAGLPVLILILSFALPFAPCRTAAAESPGRIAWIKRKTIMEAYAMAHPDTLFIYDTTLTKASNSPWSVYPDRQPTNLIYWGGSGYHSPLYDKQVRKNGFDSLYVDDFLDERICFMGAKGPNINMTEYMSDRMPEVVCLTDNSNGGFVLYRFVSLPPPEPAVEPVGENSAMLSWDAPEGAELYRISRRTEGETEWTDLCETTENRYIDETVVPGAVYYYRVRACTGGSWKNSFAGGSDTAELSIPASADYNGYQFRCVVSEGGRMKVISNAVAFTYRTSGPVIEKQPLSITAASGDLAEFSVALHERITENDAESKVEVEPELSPAFQWQISMDGINWSDAGLYGEDTPVLRFAANGTYDGCLFRCLVMNGGWTVASEAAVLTIAAPKITKQPQSVIAEAYEEVSFSAAAPEPGVSFRWQVSTDGGGQWSDIDADGSDTAGLRITAEPGLDGCLFRCTAANSKGETRSDMAQLRIKGPEITAQPWDVRAAVGDTVSFSVAAAGNVVRYQWQVSTDEGGHWSDSGATGSGTDVLQFTAKAAQDGYLFRCAVTDENGILTVSDPAELALGGPEITVQPRSVTVSAGDTAAFSAAARGTGLTFRWQVSTDGGETWNSSSAGGNDTDTLRFTAAESHDGYRFRCVVSDGVSGKTTTEAAILRIARPEITLQPRCVRAAEGETVSFTVKATGTGLLYRWQASTDGGATWSDSRAGGSDTDTLSFTAAAVHDGYRFRCVVTDATGAKTLTDEAELRITFPVITLQPRDLIAFEGETVTFAVEAEGTGLEYQWQVFSTGGWSAYSAEGIRYAHPEAAG